LGGFWPILGHLARGFYINPSRRGPAPGAGRRLPKGVGEGFPSLPPEEGEQPLGVAELRTVSS